MSYNDRPSWTTTEELFLTQSMICNAESVPAGHPPRLSVDWNALTHQFNCHIGYGNNRRKGELKRKWKDMKFYMKRFNSAYHRVRRNNPLASEEYLIITAKELYEDIPICGAFHHEHTWNLLKNKPYFNDLCNF
jgi:hypothetical protein